MRGRRCPAFVEGNLGVRKTPAPYLLVCVVTAAALIGFSQAFPGYRLMLLLDYGPLQFAQGVVLTLAAFLAARLVVLAGPAHPMWPDLLVLAALALNLAWREVELDKALFDTRISSWG